jgi:hypothetical protein
MGETMREVMQTMPKKKTFLGKLGNFMLYGGWILVIAVVLVLLIAFSHK